MSNTYIKSDLDPFKEGQRVVIKDHINPMLNGKVATVTSVSKRMVPPIIAMVDTARLFFYPHNLEVVPDNKETQPVLFKDQFDKWLNEHMFTQDIPVLNMKQWVYLFVYGTLKSNMERKAVLKDSIRVFGFATTVKNNFELAWCTQGEFPVLIEGPGGEAKVGQVKGELYKVTPEKLMEIDDIETNGRMFNRSVEAVTYKDKSGNICKVNAYIYKARHSYWAQYPHALEDMDIRSDSSKREYWFFSNSDVEKYNKRGLN